MQLFASLRDWLGELRTQRMRTISTVMGIAWGTFGVVGILAFGRGLEESMRERAEGIGPGLVVVWGQRTALPFAGFSPGRRVVFTEDDVRALEAQIPELEAICPEYIRWVSVRRGDRLFTVAISGVYPRYADLRRLTPRPGGRFLNERDQREERAVAFLGDEVGGHFFGEEDAIGRRIEIEGTPFTVVGTMEPKLQDSEYEGRDESRVCIPASTFVGIFGDPWLDYFVFTARDRSRTAEVTRRVYEVLGRRLHFDPADRDALRVMDMTEFDRVRDRVFLAMNVLITLACALTLLVGGVGVGNLMFLMVRRRTREIGLRMALGAKPRWILQEVIVEALLLVVVGGAAGFAAAWGLCLLIGATPAAEFLGTPRISIGMAGGTIAMLAVIGLLAGWFPARRAARLDPVRALAE
jgi:putative ABC transport system permease protein